MYAALYGTSAVVAELLKAGADPNARNHVGATALMWAIDDGDKVKLLLDAGADVNAASDFGRQPLTLAAAQVGTMPTVKLLLERGAEPTTAALSAAAARGNVDLVRVLLAAGARDSDNRVAATNALRGNSRDALEAITATQKPAPMRGGLFAILPPGGTGRPDALAAALERGADVNAKDAKSRTPLMLAAMAEAHAPELIRLLLARGANPAVKDPAGRTALDFARRLGSTPALDVLAAAGAPGDTLPHPTLAFVSGNTPRAAVARSLPLLQRTAVQFYEKSGCVSCHHNSLTQMTVATARRNGFAIAEALARKELTTVVDDIRVTREQALQGIVSPGGLTTTSGYILMGLAADRHPADAATDALVRLIVTRQLPDGRWASAYRPPSESSEFTAAAVGLRGIQLYGTATPPQRRAVAAAAAWLAQRAAAVHRRSCLQTARAHLGGCSTGRSAVGDSGPSRFATHRRGLGAAACDVERCVRDRLCARRAARSRRPTRRPRVSPRHQVPSSRHSWPTARGSCRRGRTRRRSTSRAVFRTAPTSSSRRRRRTGRRRH